MSDQPTRTLDLSRAAPRPQPVRIVVVRGPDRGKEAGAADGTLLVGTHSDCALQLTDDAVSRRHLSLELLGQRVRVRDLGSKNGTQYLGARVERVDVPLGATIELGTTSLAVVPALREAAMSDRESLAGLVGRSAAMRRLFAQLEQVAPTDASVLLHGETGTGKEAVARALHSLSPRAGAPFVAFDCGTTQATLMQSQLFGHQRGAFTGAVSDHVGVVESAHGGLLFLDEVAELPAELQPVLLRVLETHGFTRVGDSKQRESDFRLVAATQHDLPALVEQGRFRADLYYRLAAITLEVPPLRARLDDVALLVRHFVENSPKGAGLEPAALSPAAVAALSAYQWPGNVRELKNVVERVLTLGDAEAFPAPAAAQAPDFHAAREGALAAFEHSYLEALLAKHKGSAAAAAREAGIARSYLYKLLEHHGLTADKYRR